MKPYALVPQDLLFFRDARPTETSGGHGARWPEPSVIFDAVHAALWRAFPEQQAWEHPHRFGRGSDQDPAREARQRFGSLTTAGLFPVWKDGRWLFPAPADVTASDEEQGWLLVPQKPGGSTNLPSSFLKYTLASHAKPGKATVAPWWSAIAWQSYLGGKKPARAELFENEDLFASEWTTGIGMDPETQTQDGQRIYCAEYLRLQPEVRCGFTAALPMKQNGDCGDIRECIAGLFVATDTIIVGGQQRACRVEPLPDASICPLPKGLLSGFRQQNGKWLVKWVLLTPALFPEVSPGTTRSGETIAAHPGGWLPNWMCPESGKVLLRHRSGKVHRVWDDQKRRTVRKSDVDEPIAAHLVAACVPKPIAVTGWTERLHLLKDEAHWSQDRQPHGPRQTHLAVPAGAVYYFEANSEPEAAKLAATLNWHSSANNLTTVKNRRSTLLGEKGFGLGVCGAWDFYPGANIA